ncbi:DUF4190 domain-containing protein [Actinotalea sp. M2MS4P-6]|uniref:DUF4190 domain-containing protein n=1 Tax=Actinotalea sp. M2MS4P-6 TaxID=2983762 RepID=UPI0021E4A404|nr:DUF4190 domain-containing protein [Actinotalea sp. M2MS4P-6]MCV2393064.1 DUF4190 domain-containing protein [Actinotalea sp. M2MS4P-6]
MSQPTPDPNEGQQPYGGEQPQYGQQPYPGAQPYQQPYQGQPSYQGQQPYQGQPSYPAQQPYQQPYQQGYAYAPSTPTNTMAIVALVAGIAGLSVVPFIGSIVAVIVGPMARKQIALSGEQGDGLAKAGLILGWVGIAITVVVMVFAIIVPLIFVAASTSSIS